MLVALGLPFGFTLVSCWLPFGCTLVLFGFLLIASWFFFWLHFGFILVAFWFPFGFLLVSIWLLLISLWFDFGCLVVSLWFDVGCLVVSFKDNPKWVCTFRRLGKSRFVLAEPLKQRPDLKGGFSTHGGRFVGVLMSR